MTSRSLDTLGGPRAVGLKHMSQEKDRMAMVHCPFCDHTWKSKPEWRVEVCPECDHTVHRSEDPRYD